MKTENNCKCTSRRCGTEVPCDDDGRPNEYRFGKKCHDYKANIYEAWQLWL